MELGLKLAEAATAGAKLALRHPVTNLPLEDDGKPVCLILAGKDSAQYRKAALALERRYQEDARRMRGAFQVTPEQRRQLEELARQVNRELLALFGSIGLQLVDFKIELGFTTTGELVVADEISPDTCRLWDQGVADAQDRILDKDRFRQDLGGVVEAYGEVLKRVQGACPPPRVYR